MIGPHTPRQECIREKRDPVGPVETGVLIEVLPSIQVEKRCSTDLGTNYAPENMIKWRFGIVN